MSDQPEHPLEKIIRENPPERCTICGGKPENIGIFLPNEEFSRRIGAAPGKTRLVAYALCNTCIQLPDRILRVEQELLAWWDKLLAWWDKLNQRHVNG